MAESSNLITRDWGIGADTAHAARLAMLGGRSVARFGTSYGHTTDVAQEVDLGGTSTEQIVGLTNVYTGVGQVVREVVARFPTPDEAFQARNARVAAAEARMCVRSMSFPSSAVPVGGARLFFYRVLRRLDPAFAGLTWANWKTASAWQQYGVRLGGLDAAAAPLRVRRYDAAAWSAYYAITAADLALSYSTGARLFLHVDVRDAVESVLENDPDDELTLLVVPDWDASVGTSDVRFVNSWKVGSALQSYLHVEYLEPRTARPSRGGAPDQTVTLTTESDDPARHVRMGAVQRGSSSTPIQTFIQNEKASRQFPVVVNGPWAMPGSVDNASAAGVTLRGVGVYDEGAGQGTPDGTFVLTFTSGTLYDVTFIPRGQTTPEALATGKLWTANQTIQRSGVNVLFVPRNHASSVAWTGTPVAGDVIRVETRADRGSSEYPDANLDQMVIIPPVALSGVGRNVADTAHKRVPGHSTQLIHDARVFANADAPGATGAVADVTDSGSWTHVKVPYPDLFAGRENTYGSLMNAAGTRIVQDVFIVAVYGLEHATYPGQIRVNRVTSSGDFNARNAVLSTGVILGAIEPADRAYLAAPIAALATAFTTDTALRNTSGTLTLTDPSDPTHSQVVTFDASGTAVTIDAAAAFTFPAGTHVVVDDDLSARPYFSAALPLITTDRGRKKALEIHEELALAP